ncbi:pteridine reductase [Citrobacter koseri]|nr:pteridine reductase [Citrobacter koseri]
MGVLCCNKTLGCHILPHFDLQPPGCLVRRMGEIQDIVDAVIFLEKSQFITGEILHVDGGQSAGHW